MTTHNDPKSTQVPWYLGIIPFTLLIVLLYFVIRYFGGDALAGASQVVLLICTGSIIAIAVLFYHIPWENIEKAIVNNIKSIAMALLVLILIGAIAGSWMVSGVVPSLIYYGLQILTPGLFLLVACIVSALVSLITGSSWTTVATIGVALIGIGTVLGFSPAMTAGAIISGAYFGDKLSPLSDTTIVASSINEVPLFSHIRYMMVTTIPSFTIACVLFLVISLCHQNGDGLPPNDFNDALVGTFHISPWLMIVPAITVILIIKRIPSVITLFLSSLIAIATAAIVQPDLVMSVGDGNMFKGMLISLYGQTNIDTGNAVLNDLVSTNGMVGMLNVVFLICCSSAFGGALTGSGMANSFTEMLSRHLKKRTSIVASTVATGIGANMATGDQYLSIILTSNLFSRLYKDQGYESRLLSRSSEDSATVTSVLIPWNTCGMTQSSVLGVATLTYLPYCFFNLVSPLVSIIIAATGYKIIRHTCTSHPTGS